MNDSSPPCLYSLKRVWSFPLQTTCSWLPPPEFVPLKPPLFKPKALRRCRAGCGCSEGPCRNTNLSGQDAAPGWADLPWVPQGWGGDYPAGHWAASKQVRIQVRRDRLCWDVQGFTAYYFKSISVGVPPRHETPPGCLFVSHERSGIFAWVVPPNPSGSD